MSLETPTDSPNASTAPDWSAVEREILCPLCDYNLRGLSESRCPECGHQFEWADALSVDREVAFLFEHSRGRLIRSWLATAAGSLACVWFWQRIKTVHTVRVQRLFIFLLGLTSFATAVVLADFGTVAVRSYRSQVAVWESSYSAQRSIEVRVAEILKETPPSPADSLQRFRSRYPKPSLVTTVIDQARSFSRSSATASGFPLDQQLTITVALLLWPVVTFSGFAVFPITLRRAGIAWPQLWRVVVYCSAPIAFIWPLWLLIEQIKPRLPIPVAWTISLNLDEPTVWIFIVVLTWYGLNLLAAANWYLRIPHGRTMAILTQVFVWLAALQIILRGARIF